MLIFLYDVIIYDDSVTSSTLKISWSFEIPLSNSGYAPEMFTTIFEKHTTTMF